MLLGAPIARWIASLTGCVEYAFPGKGNDGSYSSPVDTAVVISNEPIANAGPDQTYAPRTQVILDGTESRDPNDSPLVAYQWTVRTMPSGSTASLSDPTDPRPTMFLDLAGTYVFELTVQNADGYWDSTADRVQVSAVPGDGIFVEVTWDQPSDLDLHLLEEGGPPFTTADCTWCNQRPSWGANGPVNDPEWVVGTVMGFGPEVAVLEEPEVGTTYLFAVHYYGENGDPTCDGECATTIAVMRIYVDGTEEATFAHQLDARAEFWTAAQVTWPGAILGIDSVVNVFSTDCSF